MPDLVAAYKAVRFGYGISGPGALQDAPGTPAHSQTVPPPVSRGRIADEFRRKLKVRNSTGAEKQELRRNIRLWINETYQSDQHAFAASAVATTDPWFSRLTVFWSNHFTVSARTVPVRILAGPYVSEAIEPYVMGKFEDMLLAAELHPAMIIYLDLINSIGPNSLQGLKQGKGLNENLAREILELHTLGVNGGYTQSDVTEFAKIMTGWTINRNRGEARFAGARAEPGSKLLLGRKFGGDRPSREDYGAALRLLARHSSTARFIATKLVTHFIADSPPASAVSKLEATFLETGGELRAVYRSLLALPEAQQPTGAKARTDFEFVVAALRAAQIASFELDPVRRKNGLLGANRLTVQALYNMQQQLWSAPSPAGWPERAEDWLAPTALAQRLNWIPEVVREITDRTTAEFLDRVLGPLASERTRNTVLAASNREEGLALVLASPEFNRR